MPRQATLESPATLERLPIDEPAPAPEFSSFALRQAAGALERAALEDGGLDIPTVAEFRLLALYLRDLAGEG